MNPWIKISDRKPIESDGLILVNYGGNFSEVVYFSDEDQDIKKPFRYDENDMPLFSIKKVKYWYSIIKPN